ncbi:MAG: deoxyribodipyrimidine photolyase [Gemmatimonadales bacterium]|nr:MAG: deoxyribodipyrimidine photolyase [Gemmatimonadales bacterium]
MSSSSSSSAFRRELEGRQTDPAGRRWLFVPYDQLSDSVGPLAREAPEELGIVVVESPSKGARRPYHRQKLALLLANLRHFALEQAARGVSVHHVVSPGGYADALAPLVRERGPFRMMEAAERELRADLAPLVVKGGLEILPHEGWLTTREDFEKGAGPSPPWRMDAFYRQVRKRTGILMENGKPEGGKYSFDAENREAWKGDPPAAILPIFPLDPVKEEVVALVEERFGNHPGVLQPDALPATLPDVEALWEWALEACLPRFGPFEDAMSVDSRTLFHTRVSGLLNLLRITPQRLLEDVLALDISLASREGFVRQLLGWREFVRHVHRATDGFRQIPGWEEVPERDGGAAPSFLGAKEALPEAFWGTPSGLHCLDHVVEGVWEEGYGHHITRLMVISNLATLLDVDPRALTDWFWVAYTDAFDWVVEPNVLAMGTFAVGDLMTTKPYVSGTPYIRKMSDFCGACALDPEDSCPVSDLYWAFLERHRTRLEGNRRLALPLASARRRDDARKASDARVFEAVRKRLAAGEAVTPEVVRGARGREDSP